MNVSNNLKQTVLVTGGTGFIAQHCIIALLNAGYRVRTTVRSLHREIEVRENLKVGGISPNAELSFVEADLSADAGWEKAVQGCSYVLHGASPTPSGDQVKEEDWIKPAVDGNLRVLRAARDAGVKRVVLTSAFGAIGVGHNSDYRRPFDENDWSNLNGNVAPYQKSKTLSEKAAWDFIDREGNGLELSTVNPVAVAGPALGADYSHSLRMFTNILQGQPSVKINSGFVDVRDVADLHVLAMTRSEAQGQRFIAISGESLWIGDVTKLIKDRLGHAGQKISTRVIPNWLVRVLALTNPKLKGVVPLLNIDMNASSLKAQQLLGWKPRPREEAIMASVESLIGLGLVDLD